MSHPNAEQLAMRDPAAAVLLGAISGADFGVDDFGGESSRFGIDEFGADFGETFDQMGADPMVGYFSPVAGDVQFGVEFGNDWMNGPFGQDAAPAALARPTPQQLAQMYMRERGKAQVTARRQTLLEPNRNSSAKVERYSFAISQAITIGTPVAINITGSPDTDIRPQRVVCNVPTVSFVFLSLIKVANVTITVGPGVEDAFDYSAQAVGTMLDLPTLTPANRATVQGNYTGFIPPGFIGGTASNFITSFKGWASIVA